MQKSMDIKKNLSVITAVEESDGRDSSVVRRPIETVSNPRHNQGRTVRRPLNGMGLKGKVAPPGIEPRASGLSRQCSATELRRPDGNQPPSKPLLALISLL